MSEFTRRAFLSSSVAASMAGTAAADGREAGDMLDELSAIDTMPNACAHEHWGSLASLGHTDAGFMADTYAGVTSDEVSLFDLLLCPYLHGFLACSGFDSGATAREAGCGDVFEMSHKAPGRLVEAMLPHLAHQRSVGTLMCTTLGVRSLYGLDLDALSPANWRSLSEPINARYRDMFTWYAEAMERACFSQLIRPVELSFMLEAKDAAQAALEREFTRPILRIDGFVEALRRPSERVGTCRRMTGVEAADAAGWRELLGRVFDLAAENGNVGIKQLQAYTRDLEFAVREDSEVDFSADAGSTRPFEDFIVHECLKLADDRGWPFQIHIGAANLPNSGPLPLQPLFRRYPNVKFVLIHTWPFFDECAFLAHFTPNVYLDTCWLPVLSPSFLERALETYIGFVPAHKLMLSHDSTSIEMAAGSAQLTRTLLKRVLARQIAAGRLSTDHALHCAARALHGNAVEVYGL